MSYTEPGHEKLTVFGDYLINNKPINPVASPDTLFDSQSNGEHVEVSRFSLPLTDEPPEDQPNLHLVLALESLALTKLTDPDEELVDTSYVSPEEEQLKVEFEEMVKNITLLDILRLQPGRSTPKNIDEYELIPLRSEIGYRHTVTGAGEEVIIPEQVNCNSGKPGGKPYLDTSLAIGLVYRGELRAVAGACIDDESELKVVQLQGADYRASDPKLKFKTGLHGGFFWRDTLVAAWMSVAEQLGVNRVAIQSANNNYWVGDDNRPRLIKGYDEVAARMGFTYTPASGNWIYSLNPLLQVA